MARNRKQRTRWDYIPGTPELEEYIEAWYEVNGLERRDASLYRGYLRNEGPCFGPGRYGSYPIHDPYGESDDYDGYY
jgi:hypothetical protein